MKGSPALCISGQAPRPLATHRVYARVVGPDAIVVGSVFATDEDDVRVMVALAERLIGAGVLPGFRYAGHGEWRTHAEEELRLYSRAMGRVVQAAVAEDFAWVVEGLCHQGLLSTFATPDERIMEAHLEGCMRAVDTCPLDDLVAEEG